MTMEGYIYSVWSITVPDVESEILKNITFVPLVYTVCPFRSVTHSHILDVINFKI